MSSQIVDPVDKGAKCELCVINICDRLQEKLLDWAKEVARSKPSGADANLIAEDFVVTVRLSIFF